MLSEIEREELRGIGLGDVTIGRLDAALCSIRKGLDCAQVAEPPSATKVRVVLKNFEESVRSSEVQLRAMLEAAASQEGEPALGMAGNALLGRATKADFPLSPETVEGYCDVLESLARFAGMARNDIEQRRARSPWPIVGQIRRVLDGAQGIDGRPLAIATSATEESTFLRIVGVAFRALGLLDAAADANDPRRAVQTYINPPKQTDNPENTR